MQAYSLIIGQASFLIMIAEIKAEKSGTLVARITASIYSRQRLVQMTFITIDMDLRSQSL